MLLSEKQKEIIKGRTRNKYNISYALRSVMRKDKTYTLLIRVLCNCTVVDYPTKYTLTKAQFSNKTFEHTRKELRDEIIEYLKGEFAIIKERLDAVSTEELHSMDANQLYRTAFAKEPRNNGRIPTAQKGERTFTTSFGLSESTSKYIKDTAWKFGYKSVSEFLGVLFYAVMAGAVKTPDINQAKLKVEYSKYCRNTEEYVKILKGEIEKPKKEDGRNKKRYKYNFGFDID